MVERNILNGMAGCVVTGSVYAPANEYFIIDRQTIMEDSDLTDDDMKIPDNKYTRDAEERGYAPFIGQDIIAIACNDTHNCVVYFEIDGHCRNVGVHMGRPKDWTIPEKVKNILKERYRMRVD